MIRAFALLTLSLAAAEAASATVPMRVESATKAPYRFVEKPGRRDVFYDLIKKTEVELALQSQVPEAGTAQSTANSDLVNAQNLCAAEEQVIGDLLKEQRYQDVIDRSRALRQRVIRFVDDAIVQRHIAMVQHFATQADDALVRREALDQFRRLSVRVTGIFWSETGVRMALIDGESRALEVNKPVKTLATIIAIERDRVDFRFTHERTGRQFEFPVYIGEDSGSTAGPAAKR